MANDFKGVSKVNVTTATSIYAAPNNETSILLELDIANTTAAAVTASVELLDNALSTDAYIVKDASVPAGGTLQVVSGQKIILESQDSIRVTASGACDVVCSILENVN